VVNALTLYRQSLDPSESTSRLGAIIIALTSSDGPLGTPENEPPKKFKWNFLLRISDNHVTGWGDVRVGVGGTRVEIIPTFLPSTID
jgi:hypothetical protein